MAERSITYRRDRLYEEIWAEPAVTVAKRYGVSGVALAKTCRKLAVPLPPRGYWARTQAGQHVPRPPLPLYIGPPEIRSSFYVPDEAADIEARSILHNETGKRAPLPAVAVPETLDAPHSLVKKTSDELRKRKATDFGVLPHVPGILDLRVGPATLDRALRIYHALITTLESLGAEVRIGGRDNASTVVSVMGEGIEIGIEEKVKRTEHIPTAEEERRKARDRWFRHRPWDFFPTGELMLSIRTYSGSYARRNWSDSRRHRLEAFLGSFLEEIKEAATRNLARRMERERQVRERMELQARRDAEKRWAEQIEADTGRWHTARLIRAFAETARKTGARSEEWIGKALEHADRLDPLRNTPQPPRATP